MESEQKGPGKPVNSSPPSTTACLAERGKSSTLEHPPKDLVPLLNPLTSRGLHGVSHITVEMLCASSVQWESKANHRVVACTCDPSVGMYRQEDPAFKVNHGYTVTLRTV